ncbi:MAG: oligosaccharide repeat unit polymerase family protein [Methanobrevibacter sp.]|nr:oligosaccharide repeat unit polymerase family protein [Methanobrevibacter sp.]
MKVKTPEQLKNIDIFHPYILIIAILLFIIVSIPIVYFSNELPQPSPYLYLYILIGILFFILGCLFPKILAKVSKKFKNKLVAIKSIKTKKLTKIPLLSTYRPKELILIGIVILGIVFQIINLIYLGGIPLFSGVLKAQAATKLWLFSYIFFIIGINLLLANYDRKTNYILLIIGLFLFVLTGYRTTPIAILLSVFITLYYSKNIKIKYQLIFIAIISILLILIGFIAIQSIEWQQWRLNAFELISYRAGFTLNILDKATRLAGSTNGTLFYYTLTGFFKATDPRVLVGSAVLNQSKSITATIFGPAILDFGTLAMGIQMFLIGLILKLLHILQKHIKQIATAFYGIILGQTLIWIETGPTDIVVWIFYLIGISIIIYYFYKLKVGKGSIELNTVNESNKAKVNYDSNKANSDGD